MNSRALASCLVIAMLLTTSVALIGTASADHHEGYVIEQGDQCVPVEPVSGTDTAEDFYGYGAYDSRYSSQGTQQYQDDDTSTLVLYKGPEGLSLVIVHDRYRRGEMEGTTGGTISFEVSDLPADGEWIVEDDNYRNQSDQFEHRETDSELHWAYGYGRTDGAVFTGLGSSFAVEIDPRFNDDARLEPSSWQEDGEISDWQVITATENGENFETVSLNSLDESVTIRPGSCTDGAAAGVPVEPDADLWYGVDLASVWVTTDQDAGRFDASVTQETDVSPPNAFTDERTMFTVETDDPVETLTFTLRVDRELLDRAGLEPDDIVLFSHTSGEWTTLDASIVRDTDDAVYVRAETDADATIGLGADAPVVTDVDVDDPVAGEPFDVQIVFGNPGSSTSETAVSVLVDGEEVAESSTTISGGDTAETVVTTTVEEPGETTIVAGGFERTISVQEATRYLSLVRIYVADDQIEPGETAEIVAVVENTGTASAEYTANFTIAGGLANVKTVTVESEERTEITFNQSFAEAGTYEVGIANETDTVNVGSADGSDTEPHKEDEDDEDESIHMGIPNFAAITTVLALVVVGTALHLRSGRRT